MNYREMTKTEKTITTAAVDLLAEAEEVAHTRTKKIGICDRCKKSSTKIDARGTRYIWCKKCCARFKKDLSAYQKKLVLESMSADRVWQSRGGCITGRNDT
jgi:hypothetical protein